MASRRLEWALRQRLFPIRLAGLRLFLLLIPIRTRRPDKNRLFFLVFSFDSFLPLFAYQDPCRGFF